LTEELKKTQDQVRRLLKENEELKVVSSGSSSFTTDPQFPSIKIHEVPSYHPSTNESVSMTRQGSLDSNYGEGLSGTEISNRQLIQNLRAEIEK
jgi:hypothetical protein